MWFKKKKKIDKKDDLGIKVMIIPDVFYGGADPLVYHESKVIKAKKTKKQIDPKISGKKPLISKKKLIFIIVGFLLAGIVAISWYYLQQAMPAVELPLEPKVQQPPQTQEPITPKLPAPIPSQEPTVPEAPKTPPSLLEQPLTFPKILLADSPDQDFDSLTDVEEELFNTDSGVWDTDTDGYYDGQEIFNLYNPTGFAPVKLIDSGLVREYINPRWEYRVYYPIIWEHASVDQQGDQVIFSSITGDFIELRSFNNTAQDSFVTWFTNNIQGQRYSDLVPFTNRFDIGGLKRRDDLVAYFAVDRKVFVMIYHSAGDAENIPFRHVMQVMYQSFRVGNVVGILPEQAVLPQVQQ